MYHLFSFSWSLCLRIRACPPALGVYLFHCNSTSGSNEERAVLCQSVVYVVGFHDCVLKGACMCVVVFKTAEAQQLVGSQYHACSHLTFLMHFSQTLSMIV